MHPQVQLLLDTLAAFTRDTHASFRVHCPDANLTLSFTHAAVLARPRRGLGEKLRYIPRLIAPAPKDEKKLIRAERIGFTRTSRMAQNPKTLERVEIPQIEARFVEAEEGVDWCLAALQDVHGIGDAWLWITDQDYDDWPDPLPKPNPWPPIPPRS